MCPLCATQMGHSLPHPISFTISPVDIASPLGTHCSLPGEVPDSHSLLPLRLLDPEHRPGRTWALQGPGQLERG